MVQKHFTHWCLHIEIKQNKQGNWEKRFCAIMLDLKKAKLRMETFSSKMLLISNDGNATLGALVVVKGGIVDVQVINVEGRIVDIEDTIVKVEGGIVIRSRGQKV